MKTQTFKAIIETIKVWHSSPAVRSYEWQFSRRYWHFRRITSNLRFRTRKWNYQTKAIVRGTVESGSIFAQIVKSIFWQLIFALFVVAIVCLIERFGEIHHWPIIHRDLNVEAQLGFLTTLLQVSAGFLALYFTAISVVTSTGYVRAPGAIRYLVMQEQVGSLYFRTLAQFVGVVAVMLTAVSFKIHIGVLNTLFASGFCLFAAFSFVVLGIRTFQYFDPIALAPHLNRLILRAVHAVTPAGYRWGDASFQRHHQQHVQNLFENYADLVSMAAQKENLTSKGLVELARDLFDLTKVYAVEKRKIPTASLWFRKRHRHKEWLLTSYHEVEIALATGTIPRPENEPDLLWFESEIANILARICKEVTDRGDTSSMATLASRLTDTMTILTDVLALEEAMKIFDAVVPCCRKISSSKIDGLGLQNEADLRDALAVIEGYSCALINGVLGFSRGIAGVSVDNFQKQMALVNWLSSEDLYKRTVLPRKVLEECEWLRECLDFEFRAEKTLKTPSWFCNERPARGFVRFLMDASQTMVSKFEEIFGAEAQRLTLENKHVLCAQLVQRGLECSDKLSRTLREMQSACDAYAKLNRSKEWEWPSLNWSGLETRVAAVREQLVSSLAQAAPLLAAFNGENLPDYFGHAYSVLADECLMAMVNGNEEQFSKLFPSLFATALLAFDKLRQKFISDPRNIRVSAEPLLDLLALSGYALVFSALDNKNFEALARSLWDLYFTKMVDPNFSKNIISLLYAIVEPDGRMAPRDILRMRWKRAAEAVLRDRNIIRNREDYFSEPRVARHPSPLIRAFARNISAFTEPEHVFISAYLVKRPEASGVEIPRMVEEFGRSLGREEAKDRKNDEAE